MQVLDKLAQGSPEWLAARLGKVTASRAKDARDRLKPAKGEAVGRPSAKMLNYAWQVALERISGQPVDQVYETWQMKEGSKQEQLARAQYEAASGNLVDEVGAIVTDCNTCLYSPDGLVGNDGLVEIKTLFSPERIGRIVGDGDLSDFIDQCQFGLWVSGRQWIDLILWVPSLATIDRAMTLHHIQRDEAQLSSMAGDIELFKGLVVEFEDRLRHSSATEAHPELLAA